MSSHFSLKKTLHSFSQKIKLIIGKTNVFFFTYQLMMNLNSIIINLSNWYPGFTTINISWKPCVRHVWLYGFFDTKHKTIQKIKGYRTWSLLDHVVQRIHRSCNLPSTRKKIWCLVYHIQDHRLLWPIQDRKTFLNNLFFRPIKAYNLGRVSDKKCRFKYFSWKNFYRVLHTIFKTIDFYDPYKIIKRFCANLIFYSKKFFTF